MCNISYCLPGGVISTARVREASLNSNRAAAGLEFCAWISAGLDTAAQKRAEPKIEILHVRPDLTRLRALQSVHLRQKPDPAAPDVFGLADQSIPEGSQVTINGICQVWMGSGRGTQDADNVWCPVIYGSYRGWANAYYLVTNEGQRFACVQHPDAGGCPMRTQAPTEPAQPKSPHQYCRESSVKVLWNCARQGEIGAYCLELADKNYDFCMKINGPGK